MLIYFDLYDTKKNEAITDYFNTKEALDNCFRCLKDSVKYKNINYVEKRRIVCNDDFSNEVITTIE